jgi:hypothetical protein
LVAWAATRHSPAVDEVGHLAAGLSHWSLGRFDLYAVNPPLVRTVAALPVALLHPREDWARYNKYPSRRAEFMVGRDFIRANGSRSFHLFTVARWACIPFSLLGACVCWRWAAVLYGPEAGMLALALWCFCPNILANAQMITPDTGAAALGSTCGFCFWRWLKEPAWSRAVLAGFTLGLAESVKMTWLILFAVWPALWVFWNVSARAAFPWRVWRRPAMQLGTVLVLSLLTLNLAYGFEGSFRDLGKFAFVSSALGGPIDPDRTTLPGRNRFAQSWCGALPVPLPVNYVLGFDVQKRDFESHYRSYLRGQWRREGWWYYYIYAAAVKVPLGTLILAVIAFLVGRPSDAASATLRDEVVLLTPAVVLLTLVSSQTGFNHHLRYILPAFPFAFIAVARAGSIFLRPERWLFGPAVAALVWSIVSSLAVYPHSLSYFNELAGGPSGGPAHLLDSNVDWGQDLLYLKKWLDHHPEAQPIGLAYFGAFDPRVAGIDFTLPQPGPIASSSSASANVRPAELGPRPGWYAVSVNVIHGYEGWLQSDRGTTLHSEEAHYAYFSQLVPVAWAGYSIAIYHVSSADAERCRRAMGLPLESTESKSAGNVTITPASREEAGRFGDRHNRGRAAPGPTR